MGQRGSEIPAEAVEKQDEVPPQALLDNNSAQSPDKGTGADADAAEREAAALKVQALTRGRKGRKNAKVKKDSKEDSKEQADDEDGNYDDEFEEEEYEDEYEDEFEDSKEEDDK